MLGFGTRALALFLSLAQAVLFGSTCPQAEATSSSPSETASLAVKPVLFGPGVRTWWAPKQRAIVCAVHGMTAQSGCFETLAKYLNAAGFSLVAMDMRAHGIWFYSSDPDQPKRKLSFVCTASDLNELAQRIKRAYPAVPLYCIGESLGSSVVTLAASKNPGLFDGIVLACPGTRPCLYNPFLVASDFFKEITNLDRQFDVAKYINRYSSEDARITDEMCTDKLCRTTLTGREVLMTLWFLRKASRFAGRLPANTPVLVIQGAEDRILRFSSAAAVVRSIPGNNKKLVVIPSCGHVLLGTQYLRPYIANQIIDWLLGEMKEAASTQLRSVVATEKDGK